MKHTTLKICKIIISDGVVFTGPMIKLFKYPNKTLNLSIVHIEILFETYLFKYLKFY